MVANQIKTVLLLGVLTSLILLLGSVLGGTTGLHLALIMAIVINGIAYFFSDKIVLRMYGAQPLSEKEHSDIYQTVHQLAGIMHLPMPKLWFIDSPIANAFATGRNPAHASIAVTRGILSVLDPAELRGVLAHELGHVKNRDILITTIAAILASAVGYLAYMIRNMAWRQSYSSNKRNNNNPFLLFIISLFVPFIATLIQLAISRSREYLADETGAQETKDPLSLASALKKLEYNAQHANANYTDARHASMAALFIVRPCAQERFNWAHLFATHPPIHKRVARLEEIHKKLFSYQTARW